MISLRVFGFIKQEMKNTPPFLMAALDPLEKENKGFVFLSFLFYPYSLLLKLFHMFSGNFSLTPSIFSY
jgi:hypothetical protein